MAAQQEIHRFFISAPRGLVGLLASELDALGAGSVAEDVSGCRVRGPLEFAYRLCMWSRIASRVTLPLIEIIAEDADSLATQVGAFAWEEHFDETATIAIDFVGRGMGIDHTQYGAQRIKDGITDRFREATGQRPSVDTKEPDIRIHALVRGRSCLLSLDLSGHGLHRRGYRTESGAAPLRENLAAAMLRLGGWQDSDERVFVDPMCGAGTLVIEAALIACDRAPGLTAGRFGFERWKKHDADAWTKILADAEERAQAPRRVVAYGYDDDAGVLELARANAERAGVGTCVRFATERCRDVKTPPNATAGLVASNPPYGERLGTQTGAVDAYLELGATMQRAFSGWRGSIIGTRDSLLAAAGMLPDTSCAVMQGPLEARIVAGPIGPIEGDLVNRLRKNKKKVAKWAAREGLDVFRLYDADLPEYSAAIDVYGSRLVIQEYAPPEEIPLDKAAARRLEIAIAAGHVMGVPVQDIYFKTRKRQRGSDQYEREENPRAVFIVKEGECRFRVDLASYLDTGLFPDHRKTRRMLAELGASRDVLNLFAYTGTASVYAALAGANSTTTVDLSKTYLDWAQENFRLNGISGSKHRIVRADILKWLEQERRQYDVVLCDPPTFSNSKSMEETWDVQRDHGGLLQKIGERLRPDGVILFSTNARRFKLDGDLGDLVATEVTRKTTSMDFERKPLHRTWRIERPQPKADPKA